MVGWYSHSNKQFYQHMAYLDRKVMQEIAPIMLSPDDAFAKAVAALKSEEGGYSNDPNDPGGATNYGWTQRTATAFGYTGDVKNMTWDDAVALYKACFWHQTMYDDMCLIDDGIAMKLFDQSVNIGSPKAGKFLQQALNVLGLNGNDYPTLDTDGVCGKLTQHALQQFINLRGDHGRTVMLAMLDAQQSCYYIDLGMRNKLLQEYEYGWQVRAETQPTVA
ncbi:unnamed protein product [Sphagnum balticum]